MREHLIEIKITQPGRITGLYQPEDVDALRLEKVIYPQDDFPFDVGILPTSLTPLGEPFAVLVLGILSHPANTILEARLIGALQRDSFPFLLVVPTADERATALGLDDLAADVRESLLCSLNGIHPGGWRWLSVAEIEPQLHTATLRYRQKRESSDRYDFEPDWKPVHLKRLSPSFADAELYTAAEYTFHELPYRFQHYVNEYLASDERILFAAQRPAMSSHKKSLWRRARLQAGVLILTDQRLVHLAELVPPDSANIRYGFHTALGSLERFVGATLKSVDNDNLLLRTEWLASGGNANMIWEAPSYAHASLKELLEFLLAFNADDPAACALKRAAYPPPPEKLPPLVDMAASDSGNDIPLNEYFSSELVACLTPGETPRAWALFPAWFAPKKSAQALVITERRVFVLPDLSLNISLAQIATLEFTSSILESFIAINYFDKGKLQRKTLPFPYPSQDMFRSCFEAARRCMAVVPTVYTVPNCEAR